MTYALAIHGGAGTILKSKMTDAKEAAYHAGLARALEAGEGVLRRGGTAVDAVVAAVSALEDEPLFNAGRGAVFTSAGKQEMDAAVMDGQTRSAGAVAGVFGPRHPVGLARLVMERTDRYSRRVVGWSMQSRQTTDVVLQALLMAGRRSAAMASRSFQLQKFMQCRIK